jgi:hypothetical protein
MNSSFGKYRRLLVVGREAAAFVADQTRCLFPPVVATLKGSRPVRRPPPPVGIAR